MAASTESDATREMAAYAQIVVMQARKHPGGGWLAYDQQFRQQRAAGLDLKWNDLSPSIMAATVLRSAHETCTLCHFPDHATEQCALFSQEPPKAPKPPVRQSPYTESNLTRSLRPPTPSLAGVSTEAHARLPLKPADTRTPAQPVRNRGTVPCHALSH